MARFAPLQLALALAVVVAAAVVVRSQHQDQDQERQRFRAGVNTVYVPVTVTDAAGRFVRTLNREDFVIRDNGQPQEITIFDREYRTVSAVVLMDASASMLPAFDRVLTAANDFIVRLMPGDEARIGSFAEEVRISPDFTGDRDALLAIFANEFNVRIGRRTRLWDAMGQAIEHLARADSRRVVIVITDGVDTWSSRTFDDVNGLARRHDVAVFVVHVEHGTRRAQRVELSVGPDGSAPGRRRPEPDFVVETLARETGGGFVTVDAAWAHMTPATDIMLDLHSAYLLGFTPEALDDTVHQLDVSVRARSLQVKARRSYLATADAGRDGGGS
jgi:Ca-activated chloride channel family protein